MFSLATKAANKADRGLATFSFCEMPILLKGSSFFTFTTTRRALVKHKGGPGFRSGCELTASGGELVWVAAGRIKLVHQAQLLLRVYFFAVLVRGVLTIFTS